MKRKKNIIVIKFGGSSLADPGRIRRAAASVLDARRRGRLPVAVVSAPADVTDDLLKLAALTAGSGLPPRETDALLASGEQISAALTAMAIEAEGGRAVSLTGAQAGLRTDPAFGAAAVRAVDARRLRRELAAGRIPVVAGFQGVSSSGDTTTLGRGGSDFTAVALARALGAELCEFRTDVKGVYTAHPAIVPEARLIGRISYAEVTALAELGTEVRQLRAVKYAARHAVPLRLRSSFHDAPGTLVTAAGAGAGPSCLSLRKDGRTAFAAVIGRELDLPAVRKKALAAAAAAGIAVRLSASARDRLVLAAEAGSGDPLLRALHAAFFGGRGH